MSTPRNPHKPEGRQEIFNFQQTQVSFDKNAFSELVQSQGVRLTHLRAIPSPLGMANRGDMHAVGSIRESTDSFIYKEAGCCTALFTSNSSQHSVDQLGDIAFSTAYLTLPDYYENGDPILVSAWDRFYFKDVELRVIHTQYMEYNQKGIDKLQYPATCVEHLIDADNKEYKEGVDFKITTEGDIYWVGQNRPGVNANSQSGKVYSIRYRYVPFFIVDSILHEIRVAQVTNPMTGERFLERFPYQVRVMREIVFHDRNKEKNRPVSDPRYQVSEDTSGIIGNPDIILSKT